MAITRQGGPGVLLDTRPMPGLSNQVTLAAGETFVLPTGQMYVNPGPYTFLQLLDPISGVWMPYQMNTFGKTFITSDGANIRLANLTGCAVGALITNAGSSYTSAPTVTASAGGSTWRAIVGGAINTTITITAGGAGYNFAPQLVIAAPPAGGLPATATCTVSGGVINAVTVVNQGAGYTTAPAVTILPDPREATQTAPGPTTAAVLTTALTGANTITGLVCTGQGTAQTAVPTLSFSGGGGSSAAATAIMCFTMTSFSVGTATTAYGTSQPFFVGTVGGLTAGSTAYTNPLFQSQLSWVRPAQWNGTSAANGAVTATGAVAVDQGLFQAVPNTYVLPSGSTTLPAALAIVSANVGGISDTSMVQPF